MSSEPEQSVEKTELASANASAEPTSAQQDAALASTGETPEGRAAEGDDARQEPRMKIGSQRGPNQVPPSGPPRVKALAKKVLESSGPKHKIEVPNIRAGLGDDLEAEIAAALEGTSLNEMVDPVGRSTKAIELEQDSRVQGRVIKVYHGDVFVDLGDYNQGSLPVTQFTDLPQDGALIEVIVGRFNNDEGMYALSLPNRAVDVGGDYSQISEGILIDVKVTGHNKGGLEAEVGGLRGFIPAGQVAIYRIEDFSQFVGQTWTCLVTEVNPERRRLVLSRRAVLEREKAEQKDKLMGELQVGQVREGIVSRIQDFGAFVDIGGVDGLLHVSRMAWQRIKHPSEILEVGQKIKVMVSQIDQETGKIGLSLRDLLADPWVGITHKYKQGDVIRGPVVRTLDKVGAFVQLEPGVDGLIHISELSHQRVWRMSDFIKEGQTVEAKILAVDPDQKRISLSIKALMARPEPVKAVEEEEPEPETPPAPLPQQPKKLKGGVAKKSGGAQFGLKW